MLNSNALVPIRWAMMALLGVSLSAAVLAKEGSIVVEGSWIVHLEAPPTTRYDGGEVHALKGNGQFVSKRLAATAPDVTGAARLDASSPAVQAYAAQLDRTREQVLASASGLLGRTLEASHVYRHVQNGFAVRMSAEEASRLAGLPGVALVEPDRAYRLEIDRGPELIGAQSVWLGLSPGVSANRGEGQVIGIVDSGINWDNNYFSDASTYTGGYVFNNPLGQQKGLCSQSSVNCNNKLIGVYDFTTEGTDGFDTGGHGTHVASTAAGNALNFSVNFGGGAQSYQTSGVAPRANIISYKVCYEEHPSDPELNNRCVGSAIRQALEKAIEDGVDVVNYSIGSDPRDPWDTLNVGATSASELFLNLRSAGIFGVSSAGNDGPGPDTISYPANAPWVFAVANSTHSRFLGNRVNAEGLNNLLVLAGDGPEVSSDLTAPIVYSGAISSSNVLGCGAFPSGSMSGAIALIRRGDCTFADKVQNARNAGAVAVLVYNHLGGPPITMGGLSGAGIPAYMMSNSDGVALVGRLNNVSNPTATLFSGLRRFLRPAWADRVSESSSRGPSISSPGVMKPNIAAPGSNILAAGVPEANSISLLSGTSMASPHIAGAALLIKSLNPSWTPAMIQSALETTATADPMVAFDEPADVAARGAGRAQVDRAVSVGLYLPITTQQFTNANPSTGGDPATLNLPGLMVDNCVESCTYTRTVQAIKAGSWQVTVAGDLDVSVSPTSFSLNTGQQQTLTLTIEPGASGTAGSWLDSAIVLTPSSGSNLATQRLTVGVQMPTGDLGEIVDVVSSGNRGGTELDLGAVAGLPEAVFRTSGLVRPQQASFTLRQDPSPSNPFSSNNPGARTFLVDVPADSLLLMAETLASSATDIDLFVGRDDNGNGRAELDELVCASTTPDELERCLIETPEAGTWWILVQNWQASSPAAQDTVDLEYAVLVEQADNSFVASGPGIHQGGPLNLDVYWDQPAMKRNQRWLGAVGVSSVPEAFADVGVLPVSIQRTEAYSAEPTALFAGESRPVLVPASGSQDRLFVDLPAGAERLRINIQGESGVSARLQSLSWDQLAGHFPDTPPAPEGSLVSGSGSSNGFNLVWPASTSSSPEAARYYIVLDNSSSQERLVNVEIEIEEGERLNPRYGLWSPENRGISQGIEWQEAGFGFVVWYTYDKDGVAEFLLGAAPIDEDSSVWTSGLERYTSLGGTRNIADVVGQVSLTSLDEERMIFAWRMNGAHGTDIMRPDAPATCPEQNGEKLSYTGHWFSPALAQGGTTMIFTSNAQFHIRYYFDESGNGRWVAVAEDEGDPLTETLDVLEFRGFCPNCSPVSVTSEVVGSYVRMFDSESSGTEIIEFVSRAPLNESFSAEVPIAKLSGQLECP